MWGSGFRAWGLRIGVLLQQSGSTVPFRVSALGFMGVGVRADGLGLGFRVWAYERQGLSGRCAFVLLLFHRHATLARRKRRP